jgi:wobble nucleotide-excising tRNase
MGGERVLTQIKKIKNFGVFDNYAAAADLPAFGRYNIVYGENGSGKTTLSRLLACLEAGEHPDHPSLEFAVESQSGQLTNGKKYTRKVRVFNSDYVESNIGRFDGPLRHILILGQENKALVEELKVEIIARDVRLKSIDDYGAAIGKLETDKGKLFSQIAKTIGEATSGSTLRSYRKPDAEAAFAKLADAKSLSEDELENHRATVRQEQMASIGALNVPGVPTGLGGGVVSVIELASGASARAKRLTMRSAQSAVIERLARNPAIAMWVEEGVHIHASHSPERCEFCDRPMPDDRLKALANHFSVEDQKLKEEIDAERLSLGAVIEALDRFAVPDRLSLYSELRTEYDTAVELFESELAGLKARLEGVDKALAEKLTLRTTAYEPDIDTETGPFVDSINSVGAVSKRHNDKTASFDKEKRSARDKIEAHYLLTIKEQVDEISAEAKVLQAETKLLRDGGEGLEDKRSLEAISQSIIDKQTKVSNAHAGGANLTEHLKQFLGRTDLRFESDQDGYRVLRRGKPAKRLSEGEKTAIAFLYFLVQLKDQGFELEEGIVVIDDPISSLDASAIYQAFSFLKNETQTAKQLFLLTHNFEFLRLLINWVQNIPRLAKADKTFTMVLCSETEQGRFARLAPLDKLLIEHATEYHYLFKVLYTFKSDGTIQGCYHVPNIARKVLETFLDFHVPSSKSLYQKLDETKFDSHKKTAIYKFANDLSHHTGKSFDPALVAEAQKNTTYLLEMIEAVAPLHYEGLKNLSEA